MTITLYVIFGLLFIASATLLGLSLYDFVKKEDDVRKLFKGKHLLILGSVLLGGVSLMLVFLPLTFGGTHLQGKLMTLFGGLGFGLASLTFVASFVLHYYKFNVLKINLKIAKIIAIVSGALSLILLVVLLDGLTYLEVLKFPLPTGIPFDNPLVAFYALFILGGALLVLKISDHEFYKKYGRHGILESVFYVAFPAGIIGARIWYVVGNWTREGFNTDFWSIFNIRNGGLTIIGGAIFGIGIGLWYYIAKRKEYSVTFAVDVIVPTILIAQAIGRWGNFMNQEVYGGVITNMNAWAWLPEFVKRQMFIRGAYRQPFFLVESIFNLLGYFLIRYGVGEGLKKYKKPLDQGLLYLVWYGLVRFIMEPLRDPEFMMGDGGKWSSINALIFLIVGIVAIVLNHIFDLHKYLERKEFRLNDNSELKDRRIDSKFVETKVEEKDEEKVDE